MARVSKKDMENSEVEANRFLANCQNSTPGVWTKLWTYKWITRNLAVQALNLNVEEIRDLVWAQTGLEAPISSQKLMLRAVCQLYPGHYCFAAWPSNVATAAQHTTETLAMLSTVRNVITKAISDADAAMRMEVLRPLGVLFKAEGVLVEPSDDARDYLSGAAHLGLHVQSVTRFASMMEITTKLPSSVWQRHSMETMEGFMRARTKVAREIDKHEKSMNERAAIPDYGSTGEWVVNSGRAPKVPWTGGPSYHMLTRPIMAVSDMHDLRQRME
jgi:hypothetical protein